MASSTGCQWRLLPKDFPPWGTVSCQFHRWQQAGVWEKLYDALYPRARQAAGKEPRPTAAIIDSQSVKTTEAGRAKGYDAGKKVTGRKQHILPGQCNRSPTSEPKRSRPAGRHPSQWGSTIQATVAGLNRTVPPG